MCVLGRLTCQGKAGASHKPTLCVILPVLQLILENEVQSVLSLFASQAEVTFNISCKTVQSLCSHRCRMQTTGENIPSEPPLPLLQHPGRGSG